MGAWAVHPGDGSNNLIVFLIYYEITFSTVFYVGSILFYIITYAVYRISKGRCLPGYTINNQDWPSSCPSITFDTRKWKRSDESLADYRARVVEEFVQEDLVRTQPVQMYQMQTAECRLTREELDGLRTLTFTRTPLQRRNTSKSVISVNRKPSISRKKSQKSIKVDVEIVPGPSIAVVEARTPLPDDVLAEHERTTDETCALCLDDYAEGDLLRELHCQHRFHAECVDEWLIESKRSCPVCNADATGSQPQEEQPEELPEGLLPVFGSRVIYAETQ
ncbi:E3 ubiquitin-protein ligase rnf13 [Terramyces sp. JEL0728]|nr:E3 ubiquitin-protein ligase rnf13 [Terramyces sp. JEL0728]